MSYTYNGYSLFKLNVKLKGGKDQVIYFFSKKLPKNGLPCDLPSTKVVGVNKKTGLPYLKNK